MYSRCQLLYLTLCLGLFVTMVGGFGGLFKFGSEIFDDDDFIYRKGLNLNGGYYCAQKEINVLVKRYVVVVTAKLQLEKNEFSFRLNGDVHLPWCHTWFRYTQETGKVNIRPYECFKNLMKKYMLESPTAKVLDEKSFRLDISGKILSTSVLFKSCTKDEAKKYATDYQNLDFSSDDL